MPNSNLENEWTYLWKGGLEWADRIIINTCITAVAIWQVQLPPLLTCIYRCFRHCGWWCHTCIMNIKRFIICTWDFQERAEQAPKLVTNSLSEGRIEVFCSRILLWFEGGGYWKGNKLALFELPHLCPTRDLQVSFLNQHVQMCHKE